jgi:hypothetical protein
MLLVRLIGTTGDAAEHLVEHDDRGVREDRFHLACEDDQGSQSARRVEPREMLGAENGCFSGNRRIAGTMNALLTIRSDAQVSDNPKPFNDPDQVLLSWRFRPFAQPRQGRMAFFVYLDQRCQAVDFFAAKTNRQRLVRPPSGQCTGSQGKAFQF